MNNFVDSSTDRTLRRVYYLQGVNFCDVELLDYVREGIALMDMYSRSIALHCIRVSNHSIEIGKYMGLSAKDIKTLWCASVFHDIGKASIPMEILLKPEKLTNDEYETVKTHPRIGNEFIKTNKHMSGAADILLYHHERFDGKGYPESLVGFDIPLLSRIIAVADAFDAMVSERPYKAALSYDEALTELSNEKWKQFDGDIVNYFIDLMEEKSLKTKELNSSIGLY